ncbi:MAG: universal stress protein [Thermodesulfobacteriota bacterium]
MRPRIQKILCPTDLSANAQFALGYAMDLAEKYEAEVTLLHVIPDVIKEMSSSMGFDFSSYFSKDLPDPFSAEGFARAEETIKKRIGEACQEVKNEMAHCPLDTGHIIILKGHPIEQIVETVVKDNYDMVVMGTQGQSGLVDILMGSVARGVVQKSSKPVLTVRLPD